MISIIIAVHDRPRHFGLCLAGLAAASPLVPFEVIVADDGSGPEIGALVEAWRSRVPFPILHEWEEHRGFRLARARNRGIRASRGEYLIFLDGDCIPEAAFVGAHRTGRQPGAFLAGKRLNLGPKASEELLAAPSADPAAAFGRVSLSERAGAIRTALFDRVYRALRLKDRPKTLGANLSAWREDIDGINGFDERFVGWGHEDEDLGRRLARRGVLKRFAPGAARIVHLWHPADPSFRGRAAASPNASRIRRGLFLARCRAGLVPRPLADLRARISGLPALAGMFPRACPPEAPAEIELLGPGAPAGPGGAEVRIGVLGGGDLPATAIPGAHATIRAGAPLDSMRAISEVLDQLEDLL